MQRHMHLYELYQKHCKLKHKILKKVKIGTSRHISLDIIKLLFKKFISKSIN